MSNLVFCNVTTRVRKKHSTHLSSLCPGRYAQFLCHFIKRDDRYWLYAIHDKILNYSRCSPPKNYLLERSFNLTLLSLPTFTLKLICGIYIHLKMHTKSSSYTKAVFIRWLYFVIYVAVIIFGIWLVLMRITKTCLFSCRNHLLIWCLHKRMWTLVHKRIWTLHTWVLCRKNYQWVWVPLHCSSH